METRDEGDGPKTQARPLAGRSPQYPPWLRVSGEKLWDPRRFVRRIAKMVQLGRQPLLAACTRAQLFRVAMVCDEVEVPAGETLLTEGWLNYWFFLIAEGMVELRVGGRRLKLLGPGEHFGEISILDHGPQPHTVRAATNIKLFIIHLRYFSPLIDDLPPVARAVRATLLRRLAELGQPSVFPPSKRHLAADLAHALGRRTSRSRRRLVRLAQRPDGQEPEGDLKSLSAALTSVGTAEALASEGFARLAFRPRTRISRHPLFWVAVAATVAFSLLYKPPVLVAYPGPVIDVSQDIMIKGAPTTDPSGQYLLVAVRFDRSNVIGVLLAMIRTDREVVRGKERTHVRGAQGSEAFNESRMIAAAAAARSLGMQVTIGGRGARVVAVGPGSSLEVGDVIVRAGGREIRTAGDLDRVVGELPLGSKLALQVERKGAPVPIDAVAASGSGLARLAALAETQDPVIGLPFEIEFRDRDLIGPSAGVIYALAIADILDEQDIARGRRIAASGTLDLDGRISSVGSIDLKVEAAQAAQVSVLVIPAGQSALAYRYRMWILGVDTLDEALSSLRRP